MIDSIACGGGAQKSVRLHLQSIALVAAWRRDWRELGSGQRPDR